VFAHRERRAVSADLSTTILTTNPQTEYRQILYPSVIVNYIRFSFQDGMDASRHNWWKFLLSIGITIALSVLTLVALRYVPGAVVWSIIVFSIVVLIGGTIGLWYQYSVLNNSDDIREVHSAQGLFIIAIVWTIIAFILVIVLIVLFKKIGLVVQLYKETAKALAALPLMVFIPVVITLLQIVVLIAFVTTTVWMMTGRELYKEGENTYRYEMNGVMVFTVIFNFVITCWTLRFFAGIQHMVISGSVAAWYFAK
jgi:solute carrier family 44 protein 1 (choline transporter-like protein)